MDLLKVIKWLFDLRKYAKKVRCIYIHNTINAAGKVFPNFTYSIQLNKGYRFDNIYYAIGSGSKESHIPQRRLNQYNELLRRIQRENKVECANYYEASLYMLQIIKFIKEVHPGLSINVFFNGNTYTEHIEAELQYYAATYILDVIDETKQQYRQEYENEMELKYRPMKYYKMVERFDKIEEKIKSNKNSYIISKLTNGDLSRSDVLKYPELIKAADEIARLKTIFS